MSFLSQATPLPKAKNVSLHVEASTVYLFCNLEKDFGESSSGKSILVASTSGNTPLGASNLLLGLNLFMKSRESRDVSPAVVEQLPKDFMECGESCAWRVEPRSQPSDPIVVCMRLNLGEAKEQAAASGKTILLASSKGNRKMGETGILFGLNCFRNEGKVVDLTKLVESASLQVGTTTEHSGNFRVDYTSPTKMRITHALTVPVDEASKANLRQEALVGEATVVVTISISPPKPKKRRVEPTTAAEGVAPTGGVVNASVSMKNVELACGGPADAPTLDITFNPSLTFGESASGKTIAVSTTSGAVDVSHPSDPSTAICRVNVNVWAEKVKTPVDAELVEHTVAAVLAEKKSEAMKMTLNELIQLLAERLKTNVDQISKYKTLIKAAVTATAK